MNEKDVVVCCRKGEFEDQIEKDVDEEEDTENDDEEIMKGHVESESEDMQVMNEESEEEEEEESEEDEDEDRLSEDINPEEYNYEDDDDDDNEEEEEQWAIDSSKNKVEDEEMEEEEDKPKSKLETDVYDETDIKWKENMLKKSLDRHKVRKMTNADIMQLVYVVGVDSHTIGMEKGTNKTVKRKRTKRRTMISLSSKTVLNNLALPKYIAISECAYVQNKKRLEDLESDKTALPTITHVC